MCCGGVPSGPAVVASVGLVGLQWFNVTLVGADLATLPFPGACEVAALEQRTDLSAVDVDAARRVVLDSRCQTDEVWCRRVLTSSSLPTAACVRKKTHARPEIRPQAPEINRSTIITLNLEKNHLTMKFSKTKKKLQLAAFSIPKLCTPLRQTVKKHVITCIHVYSFITPKGNIAYTGWPKKVSHYQYINKCIKSYANEIRFQIKVSVNHYNIIH